MHNDRRLYSPAPNLNGKETFSKLPVRICLGSGIGLLLALILFIRMTGLHVLYIHFWVYIAVASLSALLLLTAGAFGIWHRVRGEKARRYTAIALGSVVVILLVVCSLFCSIVASSYMRPVAFSHSPGGENSIVIMRTEATEGALYMAYPLSGSFYLAAATSEEVCSEMGVERVEWEGENIARVYVTNMDGKEEFITVDYTVLFDMEGSEAAEE